MSVTNNTTDVIPVKFSIEGTINGDDTEFTKFEVGENTDNKDVLNNLPKKVNELAENKDDSQNKLKENINAALAKSTMGGGALIGSPSDNLRLALNNSLSDTIIKPSNMARNLISNTVESTLRAATPYSRKGQYGTRRFRSLFGKSSASRRHRRNTNKKSRGGK